MSVTLADIYDAFLELDLSRKTPLASVDVTGNTISTPVPHQLVTGQLVRFINVGGAPPAPLTLGTIYYVIATGLTFETFSVSATFGGSAVNLTDAGSGATQVAAIDPDQDGLISAKLAQAQNQVDYTTFENQVNADTCVKYLTARMVALSPSGLNMKLSEKDGSTVYDTEYRKLAGAAAFGFRVP